MIGSCGHQYTSWQREIFTVWMKSLVFNGNGCTVFNSRGELVFRVDNYQTRPCNEVLVMDYDGHALFCIRRKKLLKCFRSWEVHKLKESKFDEKGEWFKVIIRRNRSWHVVGGCNKTTVGNCMYKIIVGSQSNSTTIKIQDCAGQILAEVMPKQSLSGVSLGDDVLSLIVEPQMDQSLIAALVIAHAMINHKL